MNLAGSDPVERLRKKYQKGRAAIAARIASRAAKAQAQAVGTALAEQIRLAGEALRVATRPEIKAVLAFLRSPEGRARIAYMRENFNRIHETMRSVYPTPRCEGFLAPLSSASLATVTASEP
jgi:hypothetical protein